MEAIISFGAAIVIFAAALLLGNPIVSRLSRDDRLADVEWASFSILIGMLPLAAFVAAVAYFRYDAVSMLAVLGIGCGIGLILNRKRLSDFRIEPPVLSTLELILCAVIAGFVLVGIIGSFAPPSDHDTIRYHLTLPKRDLELGYVTVHYGWSVYEFLPPLPGLITRLAYALGGSSAAQLINSFWALTAAGMIAGLTKQLGGQRYIALVAVIFFLAQRVSINLISTGTADFVLVAYSSAAFLVFLLWRGKPDAGMIVLFGLVAGGALNTKHHAFVVLAILTPFMLFDVLRKRVEVFDLVKIGSIALLLASPWLIRNGMITGNPLFPAFHHLISPDNVDIFGVVKSLYTRGEGVGFFLSLPWLIFTDQGHFDGLQFGFPFVLLFLPFAFLKFRSDRFIFLAVFLLFLIVWYLIMPHYLRFFMPIFAPMCALAAVGLGEIATIARDRKSLSAVLGVALFVGIVLQSVFLGATVVRRFLPVFGLQTTQQYLESGQFVWYVQYAACKFITDNLKKGERYLLLFPSPSYYCPQAAQFSHVFSGDEPYLYKKGKLSKIDPGRLADSLEKSNVRFVLVSQIFRNYDNEKYVFAKHRYDENFSEVMHVMNPIYQSRHAKIYNGSDFISALKMLSSNNK